MACSQVTCFRWFAIPAMAGHLCRISVAALAIFGRAMVKGHRVLPKFRWCNREEAKNDKCYVVAGWIDFFHYANVKFACPKGRHAYHLWQSHIFIFTQKLYRLLQQHEIVELARKSAHRNALKQNAKSLSKRTQRNKPNGWWSLEKFIAYGREIAKRYSQRCYRLSRSGNQELLEES